MCAIDWKLLLEYLKVVLNWPPLAFVLTCVLVWVFRPEIRQKIASISKARVGGQEFNFADQTQLSAISEDAKLPGPPTEDSPVPTADTNYQFSAEAKKLSNDDEVALGRALAWVRANPGPTVEEFLRMSEHLQFERTFSSIFGSQVLALDFARSWSGPQPPAALQSFVDMYVSRASPQTAPTIDQFLAYMVRHGLLLHVDGGLIALTERGVRFLDYIKNVYPTGWASRVW
ncbi:MAG: hypothetical protein KF871_14015 [Hydrogenophaga sp.]|uniref:hypothetical protein n=1 Tax=Hydrogenophaga sp. TaxID=1904254 RepID=UPI001DB58146|nr:hypothetical protein [Hydrogenophaga sp.]MBX3611002.1 hypothetical protein [Hydrogenophaga sp.]